MFNVAIGTPIVGDPKMIYVKSMMELILWFCQNRIFLDDPNQGIRMLQPRDSCVLSANREKMTNDFLKTDCTHLLWVDGDMGFEPQVLSILARRKVPYVGCNYSMKNKQRREFTAGSLDGKRVYTGKDSTGVIPVNFTGFGFALIERELIEKVEKPRYPIGYSLEVDDYTTEDYPFCEKARQAGYTILIDHDASKLVWHVGNYTYRYDEVPDSDIPSAAQSEPRADSACEVINVK